MVNTGIDEAKRALLIVYEDLQMVASGDLQLNKHNCHGTIEHLLLVAKGLGFTETELRESNGQAS